MSNGKNERILDERRQRIYDALVQHNLVVAGSYKAAIRSLKTPAQSGEERARISAIGNAMREIMITLPSIIGESSEGEPKELDTNALVRDLPERLAQFSDLDLQQDLDYVPIPREAAALIAEIVTAASQDTKSVRDNAAALLAEGSRSDHPAIKQWLKANQFFVKCTHLGRPPADVSEDMSDEEVERNIRIVEDLVEVRVSGFFDSRHEIDSLLSDINAEGGEMVTNKFKTPSPEEVQLALRRIPTLQLRRVFYGGNKNPNWVKPLANAGAFAVPPEPIVDEKGFIREQYWPEIDYLKEMADLAPNDVVDVLLTLKDSTVSWIRRAVFEIGAKVPADQSVRMVAMVMSWGAQGLGWRSDPRSQVAMACNLLQGGQYKAGMKLARLLFEPKKKDGDGYERVTSGLEEYWYAEELPKLVEAMDGNGLSDLTRWLIAYEQFNEYLTDSSDLTYLSRSVIDRSDSSHKTVEDALIDSVLGLSIQSIIAKPQATVSFLQKQQVIVVRRIALNATRKSLILTDEKGYDTTKIVAAIKELIKDPLSTDYACRVEFAELMQAVHAVDPKVLEDLIPIIEAGPYGSPEAFRKELKHDKEKSLSVEEKLEGRTEEWKHRLLAAVGKEILPEELQETLSSLDQKHGIIEAPLTPTISTGTTWTGPISPVDKEEFLGMSPEEIISHLETWKSGDEWQSPTHEGQGRELTSVISTNPMLVAGVPDLIKKLRPTYLRALIQGWEAAIKAGIEPDWAQLVDTTREVLESNGESPFEPEGRDFDDDKDYRQAKTAAIGLLEELAKKRKESNIPDGIMTDIANLIISMDTEESWKDYQESVADSSMDPLTISINWQWPNHVRAIVMLLTHGDATPWYQDALKALGEELLRADTKGASRAVIGERLGNLLYYAPNWLKKHLDDLVGTAASISESQQIVLTTALATSSYYNDAFDLLRGSLSAVVKDLDNLTVGWKGRYGANELVGTWIIHAFMWGHVAYDDALVQEFFSLASPENRGKAIGHIAWAFMKAEKVDEDIARRFGELWDIRVAHVKEHPEDKAEIEDFYWFVKSGKYPPDWWLPRLIEAAKVHGDLSTHGMIGEILASVSADYPRETLDALMLLLNEKPDVEMLKYDLREHAAPIIIANGLMSDDQMLKKDAEQFMHKLGSWGYINLEELVRGIIASKTDGATQ
jgi:hypothetical protein